MRPSAGADRYWVALLIIEESIAIRGKVRRCAAVDDDSAVDILRCLCIFCKVGRNNKCVMLIVGIRDWSWWRCRNVVEGVNEEGVVFVILLGDVDENNVFSFLFIS